jgi:hypothetical protein
MKKWTVLLGVFLFGLTACTKPEATPTATPDTLMPVPDPAVSNTAAPRDILGEWVLDPQASTGGGSTILDPLFEEIFDAQAVEITPEYLLFGDLGHTYFWIDAQRIRVNGVIVGFGSATEGLFYVFTVQRDGDTLRFLTSDGTPFVVFSVPGSEANTAVSSALPVAPTPWTPCEGGYETHLFKGGYAYVNPVPPEPNIVRSAPGANSPQTGLVQPNELMEITEGPQCADGWVWWQITSRMTGLSGWTSEGDGNSYWVLPCPANGSECGAP